MAPGQSDWCPQMEARTQARRGTPGRTQGHSSVHEPWSEALGESGPVAPGPQSAVSRPEDKCWLLGPPVRGALFSSLSRQLSPDSHEGAEVTEQELGSHELHPEAELGTGTGTCLGHGCLVPQRLSLRKEGLPAPSSCQPRHGQGWGLRPAGSTLQP